MLTKISPSSWTSIWTVHKNYRDLHIPWQPNEKKYGWFKKQPLLAGELRKSKRRLWCYGKYCQGYGVIEAQGGYSAARTDLYEWVDFTEEGEENKVSQTSLNLTQTHAFRNKANNETQHLLFQWITLILPWNLSNNVKNIHYKKKAQRKR